MGERTIKKQQCDSKNKSLYRKFYRIDGLRIWVRQSKPPRLQSAKTIIFLHSDHKLQIKRVLLEQEEAEYDSHRHQPLSQ